MNSNVITRSNQDVEKSKAILRFMLFIPIAIALAFVLPVMSVISPR